MNKIRHLDPHAKRMLRVVFIKKFMMTYILGFVLTIVILWVALKGIHLFLQRGYLSIKGHCQWIRSIDHKNRLVSIEWKGREYLVILNDSYGFVVDREPMIQDDESMANDPSKIHSLSSKNNEPSILK